MAARDTMCRCGHRKSQHFYGDVCVVTTTGKYVCACPGFFTKGEKNNPGFGGDAILRVPISIDAPLGEYETPLRNILANKKEEEQEFFDPIPMQNSLTYAEKRFLAMRFLYWQYYQSSALPNKREHVAYKDFLAFDLYLYGQSIKFVVSAEKRMDVPWTVDPGTVGKSVRRVADFIKERYNFDVPLPTNKKEFIQERNKRIASMIEHSGLSCPAIARQFGVSQQVVQLIAAAIKWEKKARELNWPIPPSTNYTEPPSQDTQASSSG